MTTCPRCSRDPAAIRFTCGAVVTKVCRRCAVELLTLPVRWTRRRRRR